VRHGEVVLHAAQNAQHFSFHPFTPSRKTHLKKPQTRQLNAHFEWCLVTTRQPTQEAKIVCGFTSQGVYGHDHETPVFVEISKVPEAVGAASTSDGALTLPATTTITEMIRTLEANADASAGEPSQSSLLGPLRGPQGSMKSLDNGTVCGFACSYNPP
jgi:hypothetical protein